MKNILHILTRSDDSVATGVIAQHQQSSEALTVQVIRLCDETPDYGALVERVFESDSVQVW